MANPDATFVAGYRSWLAKGHSLDQIIRSTGERVIAAAHRILSHTKPAEPTDDLPSVEAITPAVRPTPGVWETVSAAGRPCAEVMATTSRARGRSGPGRAR